MPLHRKFQVINEGAKIKEVRLKSSKRTYDSRNWLSSEFHSHHNWGCETLQSITLTFWKSKWLKMKVLPITSLVSDFIQIEVGPFIRYIEHLTFFITYCQSYGGTTPKGLHPKRSRRRRALRVFKMETDLTFGNFA